MNNPSDSLPESVTHASFESSHAPGDAMSSVDLIDPDDPPWNALVAFLLWLSSIALIAAVPAAALFLYGLSRDPTPDIARMAALATSPTGILVQVAATLPAHLLTLLLVWLVVTGAGRRPFWRTIGWTREGGMPLVSWVGVAVALWMLSSLLTQILVWIVGAEETAFERLIVSSPGARIALACLAVLTAPLVEEVVYRGVIFPAFRRLIGATGAVVGVATLFTLVHVPQYWNNPGVIVGLAFLSVALTVVRARTDSLLPPFIIHLVFNSISAALLVLEPTLRQYAPKPPTAAGNAEAFMLSFVVGLNF